MILNHSIGSTEGSNNLHLRQQCLIGCFLTGCDAPGYGREANSRFSIMFQALHRSLGEEYQLNSGSVFNT
jgi:hypothetical protein